MVSGPPAARSSVAFVRRVGLLVVVSALVAVAYGWLLEPPGCNQTAHYALVQSLARGTPRIDRFHQESCDTAYLNGHYFAAKAPGLALVTLPWFEVLRLAGAVPTNPERTSPFPAAMLALHRSALWEVGLFGAALPALLLVLLSWRVAETIVPGTGVLAAVSVGLGTMLLPFATVFFAHALAASCGFAAFVLLFLDRRPMPAGVLAGFAVCVDFPLAIVLVVLAFYAWRRVLPFAVGALVGLLPLGAFNAWAFGNPFHLAYANAVSVPGRSGHDVLGANGSGFFGIGVPSLRTAVELLASPRGLVILSPILLAASAGLGLLWRRGLRREAAVAIAVFVVAIAYNAGYYVPFGGYVPGPRFLIMTIPFLALGLAPAFDAWPLPTAALALFSVGAMTVATAAEPLLADDDTHSWVVRWEHGDFAQSVMSLVGGGHGVLAVLPFLAAITAAAAAAASSLRLRPVTVWAIVPLVGFATFFHAAPRLLRTDSAVKQSTGLIAVLVLGLTLLLITARPGPWMAAAGIPLLLLIVPGVASHTKESLLAETVALVAAGSVALKTRLKRA